MDETLIKDLLNHHSIECESLSQKAKWELQQNWREHFAVAVKKSTGKWVLGGADWHAFSFGYTPSLSGFRAEEEYANLNGGSFILISSNEHLLSYRCEAQSLPELKTLYTFIDQNPEVLDLYFFSTDFSWTVVFTHELQHRIYLARNGR